MNLKKIIANSIILILFSCSLYGFYGDGDAGRSFIDFLMDKDQFRAQTDKIGALIGFTNIEKERLSELKIGFGFTGKTSGIIFDNWTNTYSDSQNLTTFLRPGVFVGLGYKAADLLSVGFGYQFRYLHKDYQIHTPMVAFTALDNTIRFNIPFAIGIGKGDAKNTWILSTAIETRYYPETILNQIRLYISYGYARMSYASYGYKEENLQVDPADKSVYKAQSSVGFDLRFYFKFLKDSKKTNNAGEAIKFSIEPYLRLLYSMALRTLENQGGRHVRYGGNNYDINAYGFDPGSLGVVYGVTEKFSGGYVGSLPRIPNPQGQDSINDIYRVGMALPLGLRAYCENYGFYLEPSLSLTLVNGKDISISEISKKGPFFTFGYVVYSEIYFTPIPELELYLELQAGGATRWGNLDPAYKDGTALVINGSAGITWYF